MHPAFIILLWFYIVGIVLFLVFARNKVLGGWFQKLVTAAIWPLIAIQVGWAIYKEIE